MSRAALSYTDRTPLGTAYAGFDADTPIAGFYGMRLVSGGILVGICIWYGPPCDPETGEEMDRSHRWQATANDRPIDLARVWPKCAAMPIAQAEHDYLASLQSWGEANAPNSPQANPKRRIDPLTSPLTF